LATRFNHGTGSVSGSGSPELACGAVPAILAKVIPLRYRPTEERSKFGVPVESKK
jgi:hypothetical protein